MLPCTGHFLARPITWLFFLACLPCFGRPRCCLSMDFGFTALARAPQLSETAGAGAHWSHLFLSDVLLCIHEPTRPYRYVTWTPASQITRAGVQLIVSRGGGGGVWRQAVAVSR